VPNVLMTLSGSSTGTTLTDASGNYSFTVNTGGTYTVTPSKASITPGTAGINTVDVLAVQRHFLSIALIPAGCRQLAADVVVNGSINTQDVLALQRFFNGFTSGTGSCGQYKFVPSSSSYPALASSVVTNYAMYVVGDVATPFVNRPAGTSDDGPSGNVLSNRPSVILPEVSAGEENAAVKSTAVDARDNIVGFQGDFTFDERVVQFADEPVQGAGLTANNWNVSGHVLPGKGPMRTLRFSAYSTDFAPLQGSGTLFELKVGQVNSAAERSELTWAPAPDNFIFINSDLQYAAPASGPGSVNAKPTQR